MNRGLVACPLLLLAISLSGCDRPTTPSSPPASTSWYAIHFTDPEDPSADTFRGGVDQYLVEAIDQAQHSIDLAIYDLNLWSLRDALIAAHQRGVQVRLVIESDNLDEPEIQELIEAGVPVLGDRREGLMHNKFLILDGQAVCSGSLNFTTSDAYLNNNNLICITSPHLAQDYTVEFEEMFLDDRFGPETRPDTPYPELEIDGTRLGVYFSPDDGTADRLVELIAGAQESIYFLAYSFTSDEIAQALIERRLAGLEVAGVLEQAQVASNAGTEFDNLRLAGIDVRLDGNPHNMHHKVILIDKRILVTGSYNFSASAEQRNDENTLVIYDPQLTRLYLTEFERIFAQTQK
jgi:phosphatidylserine/phosphatidylglycerophosphate/cardiolipin synthase-like enzyme